MKKLLLSVLIASMLLVPMGTAALADSENTAAPAAKSTQYVPGEAPAQSNSDAMIPAVHAVLLAMQHQNRDSFTTDDPLLSWEMLYNLLSMYGQMDERSSYEGDMLVLPGEIVQDYSAALFCAPLSPDTLPEQLSDRMRYEADTDCFYLYCGSDSLSQVVLTATGETDGSVQLTGELTFLADNRQLAAFTARLAPRDNLFGYTLIGLDVI